MRDEKIIEKKEQEISIEKLWDFACGGDIKALKDYYLSECGIPNRRYNQFGEEHSLIMGAFRNGELDTVEYLMEVGETVTHEEEQEILDELRRIDIMRKLTKTTNKQ